MALLAYIVAQVSLERHGAVYHFYWTNFNFVCKL
jgi:hypothetical protein